MTDSEKNRNLEFRSIPEFSQPGRTVLRAPLRWIPELDAGHPKFGGSAPDQKYLRALIYASAPSSVFIGSGRTSEMRRRRKPAFGPHKTLARERSRRGTRLNGFGHFGPSRPCGVNAKAKLAPPLEAQTRKRREISHPPGPDSFCPAASRSARGRAVRKYWVDK